MLRSHLCHKGDFHFGDGNLDDPPLECSSVSWARPSVRLLLYDNIIGQDKKEDYAGDDGNDSPKEKKEKKKKVSGWVGGGPRENLEKS